MAKFVPVDPFDLVIFGGTGDLSRRKLLPALFHRWLDGQIPSNSRIIGSARTDMDDNGYREFARDACKAAAREDWDETVWQDFSNILFYYPIDATSADADWSSLRTKLDPVEGRPCIFYLATSPRLYVQIAEALGQNGLSSDPVRLVLEKPIGTDLKSAREINEGVAAVFAENQVYRIDHYLGKETVQNLNDPQSP